MLLAVLAVITICGATAPTDQWPFTRIAALLETNRRTCPLNWSRCTAAGCDTSSLSSSWCNRKPFYQGLTGTPRIVTEMQYTVQICQDVAPANRVVCTRMVELDSRQRVRTCHCLGVNCAFWQCTTPVGPDQCDPRISLHAENGTLFLNTKSSIAPCDAASIYVEEETCECTQGTDGGSGRLCTGWMCRHRFFPFSEYAPYHHHDVLYTSQHECTNFTRGHSCVEVVSSVYTNYAAVLTKATCSNTPSGSDACQGWLVNTNRISADIDPQSDTLFLSIEVTSSVAFYMLAVAPFFLVSMHHHPGSPHSYICVFVVSMSLILGITVLIAPFFISGLYMAAMASVSLAPFVISALLAPLVRIVSSMEHSPSTARRRRTSDWRRIDDIQA